LSPSARWAGLAAIATVTGAGLACTSNPPSRCVALSSDGGADAGDVAQPSPLTGVVSFDVTVTTSPEQGGPPSVSLAFTLVLDVDAQAAYVGSEKVHLQPRGSGLSFIVDPFTIGAVPPADGPLYFADLTQLEWDGNVLTGLIDLVRRGGSMGRDMQVGRGQAIGVRDVERPQLSIYPDNGTVDPFIGFTYVSSEPLVGTSRVRLAEVPVGKAPAFDLAPYFASDSTIASGGDGFPETPSGAVFAFGKPDVVLAYDTTYQLLGDRVLDFSGLTANGTIGGDFLTPILPVLTPPDGFESWVTIMTGGPRVVDGTTHPVLAGSHSYFIPEPEHAVRPCSTIERSFASLRLAVPMGAKALRFSYRTLSTFARVTGHPSVAVGSERGTFTRAALVAMLGPTPTTLPDGSRRYLGEPRTFELALPADAGPEVIVDFEDLAEGCGVPRSPNGLLIDDLRVE
jgi:hypothetical protein